MSAAQSSPLGIEQLAARAGIDARTIRCYEQLGLLPGAAARGADAAGAYVEADVEQALAILRLRELIGLPLESARALLDAEEALRRARERLEGTEDPERRGELAADALGQVERQLALTRERRRQLDGFEAKLWGRRNRLKRFLARRPGATSRSPAPAYQARRPT